MASSGPPASFGPTPIAYALPSGPSPPGNPTTREAEIRAMQALRFAAILGIVGLLLGLIVPYALSAAEHTPNPFGAYSFFSPSTDANGTTIHVDAAAVWSLFGVAAFGIAIGLGALLLYRRCFTELRPFDARFSTPATLAVVLMIGVLLLLGGLALVFNALIAANGCTIGRSFASPPPCLSDVLGSLLAGFGLLLVGAVLALVGAVGVLIGIYRVGDRYGSTLLKVAAILYIFPFVNLVGTILTLVESSSIEGRLQSGAPMAPPAMMMVPAPGFPPPPGYAPPPGYPPPPPPPPLR
jgi:Protein of unknown function (DUF973)